VSDDMGEIFDRALLKSSKLVAVSVRVEVLAAMESELSRLTAENKAMREALIAMRDDKSVAPHIQLLASCALSPTTKRP